MLSGTLLKPCIVGACSKVGAEGVLAGGGRLSAMSGKLAFAIECLFRMRGLSFDLLKSMSESPFNFAAG